VLLPADAPRGATRPSNGRRKPLAAQARCVALMPPAVRARAIAFLRYLQ
jgi:hypothetical protein